MKKIGITGGIGSGKTIVCKIFEVLGVPVFDADLEAKKLYSQKLVVDEIVSAFGIGVLLNKDEVDLKKISETVFADAHKLEKLNHIIHPKLAVYFDAWCSTKQHHKYIVKEAAIMIESGAYKQCDELVLVSASLDLRIERVMHRNRITKIEVMNRVNKQMTDDEKLKFVQHQITNNEKQFVTTQVLALHALFSK